MSTDNIRIAIADDHQMFIDGVKALLRKATNLEFVCEANSGEEALAYLEKQPVDVLISDISMPGISGVELVKEVKQRWPEVKVLVISMHSDKDIIAEIMLAEAEGYILKNASRQELTAAIQEVAAGGMHYSKEVLNVMLQRIQKTTRQESEVRELSPRELEVLKLIMQEYSTKEIAEALFISPRTVDTHRKHIMEKTQSRTLIGLIKFAFRNELVK